MLATSREDGKRTDRPARAAVPDRLRAVGSETRHELGAAATELCFLDGSIRGHQKIADPPGGITSLRLMLVVGRKFK